MNSDMIKEPLLPDTYYITEIENIKSYTNQDCICTGKPLQ